MEDNLQDSFPEAIETVLDVDISMWILTGDKQVTVIIVGSSNPTSNF